MPVVQPEVRDASRHAQELSAMVEALETENERLRDEIERLKEARGASFLAPLQFKLTGKETLILGRLLKGDLCSKEALMSTLYNPGVDDEPMIKIIDVFVCKIRKKLEPWGLEISTVWGRGYQMLPATIEKFKTDWGYGYEGPRP